MISLLSNTFLVKYFGSMIRYNIKAFLKPDSNEPTYISEAIQ